MLTPGEIHGDTLLPDGTSRKSTAQIFYHSSEWVNSYCSKLTLSVLFHVIQEIHAKTCKRPNTFWCSSKTLLLVAMLEDPSYESMMQSSMGGIPTLLNLNVIEHPLMDPTKFVVTFDDLRMSMAHGCVLEVQGK